MLKQLTLLTATLAICATASANLTFKAGVGYLDPTGKSNLAGGAIVDAKASSEAAILPSFDYRFGNTPFSAELLLASPFEHEVTSRGGEKVAEFKHLPPTLTFKYNTPEFNGISANIGVGATVLVPYEERMASGSGKLEADTVVAPAAQIGLSYSPASSPWGVFADARYADLSADLKLNGQDIGELEVNPVVYSVGFSHKF